MTYACEDVAFGVAYASFAFWSFCLLLHLLVIMLHAKLETTQPMRCDTAFKRFLKTTSTAFHCESLAGDLLRAGASLILLKALCDRNVNMLVNFLRYKYVEVFLLLILFMSRCCRHESGAIVRAYYVISLVLDLCVLYVIYNYCCELLTNGNKI